MAGLMTLFCSQNQPLSWLHSSGIESKATSKLAPRLCSGAKLSPLIPISKMSPSPRITQKDNSNIYFLTLTVIEWINIFTKKEYSVRTGNIIDQLTDKDKAVKINAYKQQVMPEVPPEEESATPPLEEKELVFEKEDIHKMEAYFGIPFEVIATHVEAGRNKARLGAVIEETKGYEAVQSEIFRKNPKSFLDRLSSGTCFLIKQQDRETALLLPYRDDVSAFAEVVSATDLNRKLGAFLDQVWELKSFVVLRHGRKEGLLVPTARRLSGEPELEASVKLSLVAGLTIQQTRDAIDLWLVMNRGKTK